MLCETSHNTDGARPFRHDRYRGKWESSRDFLSACIGHAFRPDIVMLVPMLAFEAIGIYGVIFYIVVLVCCILPIVFVQSFLGQFSSTGYISVFRIAPLFKGIGYVSLALDFVNLTYFAVFSAIPLNYFFNCLRPTMPWSCEGASQWMNISESVCNKSYKPLNGVNKLPSVEFLRYHFNYTENDLNDDGETYYSAELMICSIIVWSIATSVLIRPIALIGRFLRYSFLTLITLMSLCLIRFIFLPGAIDGLWEFLIPSWRARNILYWFFQSDLEPFLYVSYLALFTLGPGFGSILTMASYNDFKGNIYRNSWVMCFATLGVLVGMAFISIFLKYFMKNMDLGFRSRNHPFIEFLALPMALTYLEWSNFWTILYVSILVLGSVHLLVIQLCSLFTSLFDEFETLREIKRNAILGIIAVIALVSMVFCSNNGFLFLEMLSQFSFISQIVLNCFLLLVVLCVYGQKRFQRDLKFMTGKKYPVWMAFASRFAIVIITFFVIVVLFVVGFVLMIIYIHYSFTTNGVKIYASAIFLIILFCLIPGYCVIELRKAVGAIVKHLKRCLRTNDWYPADPNDKQRYEELLSDIENTDGLEMASKV